LPSLSFAPLRSAPHCAASRRQEERTLRQYTHTHTHSSCPQACRSHKQKMLESRSDLEGTGLLPGGDPYNGFGRFTGLLTLKLPVDVGEKTPLAACCPGLELPDITAVSSSKTSRLSPTLCALCALQPTPQSVSAVSGWAWCACSQPRRLGAHARFLMSYICSCRDKKEEPSLCP
jgi:hypothetical protein